MRARVSFTILVKEYSNVVDLYLSVCVYKKDTFWNFLNLVIYPCRFFYRVQELLNFKLKRSENF